MAPNGAVSVSRSHVAAGRYRITVRDRSSRHDFLENAFYWDGVTGFTGSYLTVWNVRGYGIYSEDSTGGLIEHDYVSGAAATTAAWIVGASCGTRMTPAETERATVSTAASILKLYRKR